MSCGASCAFSDFIIVGISIQSIMLLLYIWYMLVNLFSVVWQHDVLGSCSDSISHWHPHSFLGLWRNNPSLVPSRYAFVTMLLVPSSA